MPQIQNVENFFKRISREIYNLAVKSGGPDPNEPFIAYW